jgi:hypothetical protein
VLNLPHVVENHLQLVDLSMVVKEQGVVVVESHIAAREQIVMHKLPCKIKIVIVLIE